MNLHEYICGGLYYVGKNIFFHQGERVSKWGIGRESKGQKLAQVGMPPSELVTRNSRLLSALSDHMPRMLLPRRLGTVSGNKSRYDTRTRTVRAYCVFTHLQTL
jgi:hypothetical protein